MKTDIVIPVYNEQAQLCASVAKVDDFVTNSQMDYSIVIADNGSTDRTFELARELVSQREKVRAVHLGEKGRGGALKRVWMESTADMLAYMDVDLSTDLTAFPTLVRLVATEGFDLAVGSRLLPGSEVTRGRKREIISRSYNFVVRRLFGTRLSDAQCGFKAISRAAARELLPLVEDNGWFFDTELMVLGEKLGYRIREVPVRWVDDPDSRVKILSTALADIRGLIRLKRKFLQGKYAGQGPNRRLAVKNGVGSYY